VKLAQYLSVKTNSFLVMRMWLFLVKTTNGLFCIQRETKHYNYFGHRHLPMKVPVGEMPSMWIWWLYVFTYGVLMGQFRNQEVLITRLSWSSTSFAGLIF
jgi:hypothetical protein